MTVENSPQDRTDFNKLDLALPSDMQTLPKVNIQLLCEYPDKQSQLEVIGNKWGISHCPDSKLALVQTADRLELRNLEQAKFGAVYADFVGGAVGHRRKFGGGKGQAIAKAAGLNKGALPSVLDATAGLGRDAFVLASLGCKVQMIERNPVVAALLDDGLSRAMQDSEIGGWVSERMSLLHASSHNALLMLNGPASVGSVSADNVCDDNVCDDLASTRPDVIYLDPMYPHPTGKKSAQVKKEMFLFQSLVGGDLDANELLAPALQLATKRVVVKRPDYAEFLANQKPSMSIETKKNRFDVYVKAAMSS